MFVADYYFNKFIAGPLRSKYCHMVTQSYEHSSGHELPLVNLSARKVFACIFQWSPFSVNKVALRQVQDTKQLLEGNTHSYF